MQKLTKEVKKAIMDRTIEMFLDSVVMSAVICLLCITGSMPVGSLQRSFALTALPFVYIVRNFFRLRKCYLIMVNEKSFFIANLFSVTIYATVSIVAYIIAGKILSSIILRKAYSWVFLVTYFLGFSNFGIPSIVSIALCHIILFISVFLAPIGLGWIHEKRREKEEFISRMPGMLEVNPLEPKSENKVKTDGKQEETPKNNLS